MIFVPKVRTHQAKKISEPVTRVDEWLYEEFKETPEDWFEKDETHPKRWKDGDLHTKRQGN